MMGWSSLWNDIYDERDTLMCEMQGDDDTQKKTATMLLVATNPDTSVTYDVSQRLHLAASSQALTNHLPATYNSP